MKTMKAVVFRGIDRIAAEEVSKPTPKAAEAVIRIITATGQAERRLTHHRHRFDPRAAGGREEVRRERDVEHSQPDTVPEIKRLTCGRGVDVTIEALGRQQTCGGVLKVALYPSTSQLAGGQTEVEALVRTS